MTSSLVWVQPYDFGMEYWHPKIVSNISKGMGVLVQLDNNIITRVSGQYALVLVDVDLASHFPHKILVKREGYSFFRYFDV